MADMFFGHSKFWFFGILKIFGYIRADLVCKCMLRTIWGFEASWVNVDLRSLICDDAALTSFLEDGQLVVDENGLRLSDRGLLMADYIIPFVLSSLERQFYIDPY